MLITHYLRVMQHSPRCGSPQCFVRIEQGSRVLSEGNKVICDDGERVMSAGAEGKVECDSSQRQSIDEFILNPIVGQFPLE